MYTYLLRVEINNDKKRLYEATIILNNADIKRYPVK